jgi:hypothetical protein
VLDEPVGLLGSNDSQKSALLRLLTGVLAPKWSAPDLGQVREVVGLDDLSLDDGEEDLYLVRPGDVYGGVDHDCVRNDRGETVDGLLSPVGGAIVDDPEDTSGARVMKGTTPVFGSQRPKTFARWTS